MPVFTRKKLVVDAGAGSVPSFATVGARVKAALGRTLLGGFGTAVTTRSEWPTTMPCTVSAPSASPQLSLSNVSTMAFAESAQACTLYVADAVSEYTLTVFCTVADWPASMTGMVAVPFRFFSAPLVALRMTYFIVEAFAWARPAFFTTTVIARSSPAATVLGKPATTDVTIRFGCGVTWILPDDVRQLFSSSTSGWVFSLSAQACSLYCPGAVSGRIVTVTGSANVSPDPSAGTSCEPFRSSLGPPAVGSR